MNKDSLGNRMKSYYEDRSKFYLTRRIPVIIRLDGKAFHTYTKPLKKDIYNRDLVEVMNRTALYLCKNIQGCQLAYVQSDEISLLLTDYNTIYTDAWFGYSKSKIESISASYASVQFTLNSWMIWDKTFKTNLKPAYFDSRSFNIPKEDVCNYFIWRQQDAQRNSLQLVAQSLYSHKELHGVKEKDLQELCFKKGVNYNDLDPGFKRGRCIIYDFGEWIVDNDIPIFTQNRNYIEDHVCEELE